MQADRWSQIEQLYHAALEHQPHQRRAFLAAVTDGDEELRREVATLLAHDDSGDSFLESPALAIAAQALADQSSVESTDADTPGVALDTAASDAAVSDGQWRPGEVIRNFRIVHKLGAGGMGEVYLADDLKLGRRVALKLLPGADSESEARERFVREARAASALNHRNIVTIHEVADVSGSDFIVMEYVEGQTLAAVIASGPVPIHQLLEWAVEIVDAIAAAHSIGIIHRDLKPANILIAHDGKAKIVDFGLAKIMEPAADGESYANGANGGHSLRESPALTRAGLIPGTVPYMSPEQARGERLDPRSDIFSLGCVLYEAATGRRPFGGKSAIETIRQIETTDPPRPSCVHPALPRSFDRIIRQSLAKDRSQRHASAADLAADLRRLRAGLAVRRLLKRTWLPVTMAAALVVMVSIWFNWRRANIARARATLPSIEKLIDESRFFEAYDLMHQVAAYIPDDPKISELSPWVTDVLSVTTDPPEARVYLRRFARDDSDELAPRTFFGETPLKNLQLARGDYLMEIEKDGYIPFRRTISSALGRLENGLWIPGAMRYAKVVQSPSGTFTFKSDSIAPLAFDVKLFKLQSIPERMVFVPGSKYQLVGWGRPTDVAVELDDFFVDQFEVTNEEYKEFIDAGGYENRRFWKHPFVKDGRVLSWDEAVPMIIDHTGKPGPRGWMNQMFVAGTKGHPVTDVTWYEAAAYAEFRGKQLPTVFQWEKAGRDGLSTVCWGSVMPWGLTGLRENLRDRANLASLGTVPVDSFEFGISPYGCHHMSGNVAEWCQNACPAGFTTTGGSWRDGPNLFSSFGQFPGFYSGEGLGFRCVLAAATTKGDQGAMPLADKDEVPEYDPVSEDSFRLMRAHYDYDAKPLDFRNIEKVETEAWVRHKITYVGAAGQRSDGPIPDNQRALAYLWLPKNASPPFQVVNYKPGGASYQGLMVPQETEIVCGPIILGGRAVFVPVLEGMRERDLPPGWLWPAENSVAHREMMVKDVIDQRRGLDYLATRGDIDMNRIACLTLSSGGFDLVTMAVEDRFRGVLLLSAGIPKGEPRAIAEADPVNFAPFIKGPKLMIHGRYDEGIPFKTGAEPLFKLLREPKEMVVLETGHFPPMDQWVPVAEKWLDKVLGPIETQ